MAGSRPALRERYGVLQKSLWGARQHSCSFQAPSLVVESRADVRPRRAEAFAGIPLPPAQSCFGRSKAIHVIAEAVRSFYSFEVLDELIGFTQRSLERAAIRACTSGIDVTVQTCEDSLIADANFVVCLEQHWWYGRTVRPYYGTGGRPVRLQFTGTP